MARVVLGPLPDGSLGLRTSAVGADAFSGLDDGFSITFDSRWTDITKIHAVGIAGFAFIAMPENSQSPTNPAWRVRCSFPDLGFKPFAEVRRVDGGNIVHDDWIDPNNPGGSYSLIYQSNTYTGGYSANQGWQVLFAIYPIPVPSG
jgi:hypothetical protein